MAQTAKPYATVPTLFERVEDELIAIEEITRVLGALPDHETRVRVIAWISERFSNGFPASPHSPDAAAAHRPVDSSLTFPDDLFEPVGAVEPADLHGVFDPPPDKPHLSAVETTHRAPAEPSRTPPAEKLARLMVVKPEPARPADSEPAPGEPRDAARRPPVMMIDPQHDVFELVPPTEAPLQAASPDDADDQARPPVDQQQLKLLLLADMTPPAALAASLSSDSQVPGVEPPADEANGSVRSTRKAWTTRPPAPQRATPAVRARAASVEPAPAAGDAAAAVKPVVAATPAADAARPAALQAAPSEAVPAATPPAADSMEALLRSLVADFRELADEWGNT
jgi:hypothetical protein